MWGLTTLERLAMEMMNKRISMHINNTAEYFEKMDRASRPNAKQRLRYLNEVHRNAKAGQALLLHQCIECNLLSSPFS